MALKHEELTKVIRECIFEVHNEVGVGLDEESYHLNQNPLVVFLSVGNFLKTFLAPVVRVRKIS